MLRIFTLNVKLDGIVVRLKFPTAFFPFQGVFS